LRTGSQFKLNNARDRPALRLTITKHPRRGEGYSVPLKSEGDAPLMSLNRSLKIPIPAGKN